MMISRLKLFVYMACIRAQHWFLGPATHCYNCVDCEQEEFHLPDGPIFYCLFRGEMEIEPTDTCRAFKGWRNN